MIDFDGVALKLAKAEADNILLIKALKIALESLYKITNRRSVAINNLQTSQGEKLNAGYNAFRCPTQAELARFHTYPVEIMQKFTPPQAQSLMGDGWHCGSIQWLFDKLKEISGV